MAHSMNEVPNDNVLVNENPPVHNKEIEEEVEFENVEEVENEEEVQDEAIGIPPIDPVLAQQIMFIFERVWLVRG